MRIVEIKPAHFGIKKPKARENAVKSFESRANIPELHAHDLEFLTVVAKRLVAKC